MLLDEKDYIEHFGVRGMKWGVRKDTNASGSDASRERKAAKYDKVAKDLQGKISELEQRSPDAVNRKGSAEYYEKVILTRDKNQAVKDAEAKREGKLTDKQKKLLKGAAIAGGVLAAYGVYTMVQSGEMNRSMIKGKAFISGNKPPGWKVNKDLTKQMSPDALMKNVVKQINPNYGSPGTKVNCRRCTFAYEMRRRGFDVGATRTTNSRGQDMSGLYNVLNPDAPNRIKSGRLGMLSELGTEVLKKKTGLSTETPFKDFMETGVDANALSKTGIKADNSYGLATGLISALRGQPDGSRGEVGVTWAVGGGHSVAYEVIKGKPVIFDTQSGKKYTENDFVKEFGTALSTAGFTRLDNVKLNEDYLMRWLKDA